MTYLIVILAIIILAGLIFFWKRKKEIFYVKVYDSKTQSITKIPKSELKPGMMQVKVEGYDEILWINASQLKKSQFQHGPFAGKLKEDILEIQDKLSEVYPHDYNFWEDGFRRDRNPESEINIWLKIAKLYEKYSLKEIDLERKQDIFKILAGCSNSSQETVLNIVDLKSISQEEARIIITDYYNQ